MDRERQCALALRDPARLERPILRGVVQDQHLDLILGRQSGRHACEDLADRLLGVVGDDENEETMLASQRAPS